MKVRIKREFYEKFRHNWESQSINSVEYDEFDVNKEYIVLGICFITSPSNEGCFYMFNEFSFYEWELSNSNCFYIVDGSIPNDWSIKDGLNNQALFMTFGAHNNEMYDNFIDYEHIYAESAYKLEIKRYYEMEVTDFFANTNLEVHQRQSMIEYYKSQPDRVQWDKDAEFLSEYVVKSD